MSRGVRPRRVDWTVEEIVLGLKVVEGAKEALRCALPPASGPYIHFPSPRDGKELRLLAPDVDAQSSTISWVLEGDSWHQLVF